MLQKLHSSQGQSLLQWSVCGTRCTDAHGYKLRGWCGDQAELMSCICLLTHTVMCLCKDVTVVIATVDEQVLQGSCIALPD